MSYEFELNVSTKVTAEVVEKIISSIVEEKTNKKVEKILTRMTDNKFDGFEIHFKSEIATDTVNKKDKIFDKTFKVFKWE